jgi:hypothetical protein
MDNYTIEYEVIYREKYCQNLMNIKFIYNDHIIFNFQTIYSKFYEIFAQNYNYNHNYNYYYYQLSENCELEIENVTDGKNINFILINTVNDGIRNTNKMIFSVKINDTFHIFLEKLKYNHSKIIRNSKW